ncbi:MAG: hypothetical protein IPN94_13615 [Sphingobacteriales bacterium]|nr:hypothetical protein [Sphingobacteriales bacterium]
MKQGMGNIALQAYLWHIYNKEIHKLIKQYEGQNNACLLRTNGAQPELVVSKFTSFLAIDFTLEMLNHSKN